MKSGFLQDPQETPNDPSRKAAWAGPLVLSLLAAATVLFALSVSGWFGDRAAGFVPPAGNIKWIPECYRGGRLDGRGVRILLESAGPIALLFPLFLVFWRNGTDSRKAFQNALLAVSLLAGTLLRVHLWAIKSFWLDSYALKAGLRMHSWSEILSGPLGFEQSAPIGFCLLEKAVGELSGWNDQALTFPLLRVGIGSLFLFSRLLVRAGITRFYGVFSLLFALSPQLVFYSAEFKQYGFDVLFAILSLLAAVSLFSDKPSAGLLVLVFVVGPFFSHTQFFLLPGLGLFLFLKTFRPSGRWRFPPPADLATFLICAGLGGVATLSSYIHTVVTMPRGMFGLWANAFPPVDSVRCYSSWWLERCALSFRDPICVFPVPAKYSLAGIPMFLPAAVLIVWGMAFYRRKAPAAVGLFLCALLLVVLAATLKKWPVVTGTDSVIMSRQIVFLLPFSFFFLCVGIESAGLRFPRTSAVVLAIISAGVFLRLLKLDDRHYSFSWPDAVAELARRATGDSPILIGKYHSNAVWAYAPDWAENNRERIVFFNMSDPKGLAERLDGFAENPPEGGFWILWAERFQEKSVAAVCKNHLPGWHADFVHRSPAGVLQHFPGRRAGAPVPPESGVH